MPCSDRGFVSLERERQEKSFQAVRFNRFERSVENKARPHPLLPSGCRVNRRLNRTTADTGRPADRTAFPRVRG